MADIRCGRVSDSEASAGCERSSREARRRRIEIRRFKFVAVDGVEGALKRQKMDVNSSSPTTSFAWDCENALDSCVSEDNEGNIGKSNKLAKEVTIYQSSLVAVKALGRFASTSLLNIETRNVIPRFGVASVCGRRRDMEDAVAVHPSFFQQENGSVSGIHYFAVYDGHGCSHVAMKCRDRLHLLVKEELLTEAEGTPEWKETLERSFNRMDEEVVACNESVLGNCRCELQTPECDAVGSTAVITIVTPQTIIVANCGDSRAVLCRNGKAVPLSTDHKPDRPDELNRIQEAGGRVLYWDGPRVLGVLAMSRAIGDNYLKPYVSSKPEVTITDRTADDDCLILASDGLWDVVSNDTACGVSRMCLRGKPPLTTSSEMNTTTTTTTTTTELGATTADGIVGNKACSDASMLLTKLALARQTTDNVSVVVIDLRKNT